MGRLPSTLRSAWLLTGVALLLGLALSIRHLGSRQAGVIDSGFLPVEPRLVQKTWAFVPPILFHLHLYPLEPDLLSFRYPLHAPNAPLTREGASVGIEGSLTFHVRLDRVLQLHRLHAGATTDTLVRARLLEEINGQVGEQGYAGLRAEGLLALEAQLQQKLRDRLGPEGVVIDSLSVERLEFGSAGASAEMLGRLPRTQARVLLVGLDGADWNLIDPLLEQGRLPTLEALIKRGTRARLRTLAPVLSPVLWTSIATGKRPEKHGILDFLATSRETGERVPVTSNLRRARPLWHILGDYGLTSSVVAWWATWPAEPVHGTLVTDRIAYQLFGVEDDVEEPEGKTYPPDLYARLRPMVRRANEITDEEIERFVPELRSARLAERYPDLIYEFRRLLASAYTYTSIALFLMRDERAAFHAVYLEGIDTVSHLFSHYRPPRHPSVKEEEVRWFGGVVDRFYEYQDEVLAQLMVAAGADTTLIVCSDHGFRSDLNRPAGDARIGAGRAAQWHRKYGILVMAGEEIGAGLRLQEASILDVAPTLLALFGLPMAEDFDGRVLEKALNDDFLEKNPLRTVVSYEPTVLRRAAEDPITSAADDQIRQKLAALGYLSLEGSNVNNNRGTLFLSEGRVDEAIAEFEEALRVDANFLPVKINLARAIMQKQDFARALEILKEVHGQRPDLPEVENLIGNILMEKGDYVGAETRFRRAVELDAHFTDAHNSLGILYETLGRSEDAERAYREVSRIDPDYAEAYNNLGNLLRARGLWEEAVREYERAIEADPDFHGSYNNLGLAFQERERLEEALAILERGLQKAPRSPTLHSSLGSVHYSLRQYSEAVDEFRRAIELDVRYEEAYNNLGAALGALGRTAEQEEAYREAIRIAPGYSDARHNLALALASAGKREEAIEELERSVESQPDHLDSWIQLALLRAREEDYGEAIRALERAKGLAPDQPAIYNHLGRLYQQVGQEARARRQWRRSLELAPDQPHLRERLQEPVTESP